MNLLIFHKIYKRIYNKLVRDKIPNIIKEKGKTSVVRTLDESEYKNELGKKLYEEYNEAIEATNHLSYIKDYIKKSFNLDYLDDVIISAEVHKIKPNSDFYEYILNKYNIAPNELLFLDDNFDNVSKAKQLGINTIKVTKGTNLFTMISKLI